MAPAAIGATSGTGGDGLTFLEAMYEAGFGPWHDVLGIHLSTDSDSYNIEIDEARRIMARYGDGGKRCSGPQKPAGRLAERGTVCRAALWIISMPQQIATI